MKSVIIPMAGAGSRFRKAGYTVHKPLIKVNNKTLIELSVESLGLRGWQTIVVARDLGEKYREELEQVLPYCRIIWINQLTSGATETALKASEYIDQDDELIITNCDQFLDWAPQKFLDLCHDSDGAVLTYESTDPKNSFALLSGNQVLEIVEKQVVSNHALVGLHWWKKAKYFIESGGAQLSSYDGSKETYISETYTRLIEKGKKICAFKIDGKYWPLGTPEDLTIFKGFLAEYETPKPKTLFIDLDGTLFIHGHKYSELKNGQELCPGVLDCLNEADSNGDKIILVSARKESARNLTIQELEKHGVPYDQLILGATQGLRVVINDIPSLNARSRAKALNIVCNSGFKYDEI